MNLQLAVNSSSHWLQVWMSRLDRLIFTYMYIYIISAYFCRCTCCGFSWASFCKLTYLYFETFNQHARTGHIALARQHVAIVDTSPGHSMWKNQFVLVHPWDVHDCWPDPAEQVHMVNVHYLVAPGSVAWYVVRVGSGLGHWLVLSRQSTLRSLCQTTEG